MHRRIIPMDFFPPSGRFITMASVVLPASAPTDPETLRSGRTVSPWPDSLLVGFASPV